MTTSTGHEKLTETARRLWDLQNELVTVAVELSRMQVEDSGLARTLGDDGEFFEVHAAEFAVKCKVVASRMEGTVAFAP
jgi:hypothetical protein